MDEEKLESNTSTERRRHFGWYSERMNGRWGHVIATSISGDRVRCTVFTPQRSSHNTGYEDMVFVAEVVDGKREYHTKNWYE